MSQETGRQAIGVLVRAFPSLSETFILHEFLELDRQGIPVRLMARRPSDDRVCHPEAARLRDSALYLTTRERRRWLGPAWYALRRHPRATARAFIWLARSLFAQLRRRNISGIRRELRTFGDALILVRTCDKERLRHVHAHFTSNICYVANMISGLPYSSSIHAADLYRPAPKVVAGLVANAQAVVACTQANRDYLEDVVGVAPGTVRVLRHGIPLQPFLDVDRSPVPGRLLTVARIVPKKGYDVIARAIAVLASEGRDVHWHIGGQGDEQVLVQLLDQLGVADRVRFLHGITSDQVRAELASAQVFVLAPRVVPDGDRDGVPNVLLEAMAAGVPVVTTAVSGIPEVVQSGHTGLLVAPDDPSALAAALATLLDDPGLRGQLASDARAWAVEHCDLGRAVAPLAALLSSLTRN